MKKAANELTPGDILVDAMGNHHAVEDLIPLQDGRIFIETARIKMAPMGIQLLTVLSDEEHRKLEIEELEERGFRATKWWRAVSPVNGEVLAETSRPKDFKDLGITDIEGIKYYHCFERFDREWMPDTPDL